MTTHAFIIPRNATPDDIERARPPGAGDSRCHSELVAAPTPVVDRYAMRPNYIPAVAERPEPEWWKPIVNGLWHAWWANELCDTWTLQDLADEMTRQLMAEAEARCLLEAYDV